MATNIRADEWASWEVDPSTRTSVHAFTKYAPITTTLSTTAADIYTVNRGVPSVNLVRNPQLGDATIGGNGLGEWTVNGLASALARTTDQQATGTHSFTADPANAAAGEGYYWASTFAGHPEGSFIFGSCEVRGASGSGTVKITVENSSGTILATGTTVTLSTGWQRLTVSCEIPERRPAEYRVAVRTAAQHNITWYNDKWHVEVRKDGTLPAYVDGEQGLNYEWIGTAHLSGSKRRAGMSTIRGLRLKNDHASIAVYVAFDQTASATTGFQIAAGEVFETVYPIDFRSRISAIAASGTPAIHGVVWGIHQG